jgi:hypothetical protein
MSPYDYFSVRIFLPHFKKISVDKICPLENEKGDSFFRNLNASAFVFLEL